ncbi:hypothetical protein [Candidatus Uabimicrobium sp. HlEnr_7]|uniref:hypothetical protein n=1 Tax=Candidatus Uabimicrobium helgolandensis TaxID=3095367 RepID=UPI003558282D
MLSFQWNISPISKKETVCDTFVVIEMSQVAGNITSLRLYHQGWNETSTEIYQDYEKIWDAVLQKLQKSFEKNN